ncbi:hypothetical protein A5819_003482 [Enterococcus sp. 7E2_DIV0204]|uniref:hypothetical protein n=1 Tax=unclassified Enterococcus TaxID=2608891 RepID=UPI000A34C4AD|nr:MULTISPECIES: hypothetical protein [unclassified Enterococcus]OTN83932.1 hypothetical protein A5819_003482 [Enterococcus sp. 7E2_DIV0204]OTP46840.1 hypothetical protein A5884_003718 [Enterococcus sp. 7D2_DIV0200]
MANILLDKLNRPRLISALTIEERSRLLKLLSNEQIQVVNNTRRYKAISIFANKHMIAENEWSLVDYKISNNYKGNGNGERLYCECGRELKYQYVVKSNNGEQKDLGFTHYLELTNLNPDVARQITMDINQLNLKVDEILVLIEHGFRFPEEMYTQYKLCKNITSLNDTQVSRVEEFRKYDLPLLIADYEDMERIIRIEKQHERANKQQRKPMVRETVYEDDSIKKQKHVIKSVVSKKDRVVPTQHYKFLEQVTEHEFTKSDLKQGNTFKIYPNDNVVNIKKQGYLNVKTKQYISEYDLFRKVLVVYGTGNHIIARRDDTHEVLKWLKKHKKFLNKGISLTEQDITLHGYSVRCFNNNVYVNTNDNHWINVMTFNIVPNSTIYKNVKSVINSKGFMIAKRKNPKTPLLSIKPKAMRK